MSVGLLECEIERKGFGIKPGLFTPSQIESLREATSKLPDNIAVRKRDNVYGVRNLLSILPELRSLALTEQLRETTASIAGASVRCVRAIFFDKPPDANWRVPWHQDLSIAVEAKADLEGFGPWSTKAGVIHVQPPDGILERMITARIHLDDCGEDNGALKVIEGSHTRGKVSQSDIVNRARSVAPHLCKAKAGDTLFMRPLLFHASDPGHEPSHRRVIHLEFSPDTLPAPLQWNESW